ncbi:MAG: hypothetical protein Q8P12_02435 [bacterium]|nr:hypothetical protein [bacterium]
MMYSVLRVAGSVADLFAGGKEYSSLPIEIRLDKPGDRVLSIDLSKEEDWDKHLTEIEKNLGILETEVPAIMSDAYERNIDSALDTPEDKQARGLDAMVSSYSFGLEFLAMLVRRKIDLEVTIYLSKRPAEDG